MTTLYSAANAIQVTENCQHLTESIDISFYSRCDSDDLGILLGL